LMTMHGAKGLSARVVFIPGLEEQVFPGPRRRPYPGLIEEAARLLYVSITRGRAACILSFARHRLVHGKFKQHAPSRFSGSTGGVFNQQLDGLTRTMAARIQADCKLL
jgi:DNA helicase II / ATP-dependent DNA helicase PcrA